jgi:hypothetical protein
MWKLKMLMKQSGCEDRRDNNSSMPYGNEMKTSKLREWSD